MIHPLGSYSYGIKIDAIPGRFHSASTLRSLFKGEHRGFRYESCGQGHSPMFIVGLVLVPSFLSISDILSIQSSILSSFKFER